MAKDNKIRQKIAQVEDTISNVKQEIKTLKNRVRAYKGWTTRYRTQQHDLRHKTTILENQNLAIRQEKDQVCRDLEQQKQKLSRAVLEASEAKNLREQAEEKLNEVIAAIEKYKEICTKANKITYADKTYLIQEAEKLFFGESILEQEIYFDPKEQPQMRTDMASINRSLLDR